MSLVADYSSSSSLSDDSNDSSDDNQEQNFQKATQSSKSLLPSANHLFQNSELKAIGQVLNNPFREAENAKIALLEKHVKMVNKDEHLTEKNGRKICWNYRKGRCRFGSKCTFAHDSDLNSGSQLHAEFKPAKQLDLPAAQSDDCEVEVKKRKRPGLGDSVVPSKKVLKSYLQGKSKKFATLQ